MQMEDKSDARRSLKDFISFEMGVFFFLKKLKKKVIAPGILT